jgi:hypothetical protein
METLIKSIDFKYDLLNFLKSKKTIEECLIFFGEIKNRLDLDKYDLMQIEICIHLIAKKCYPSIGTPFEIELMEHFVKLEDWKRIDYEWIEKFSSLYPEFKIKIAEPPVFF